MKAPVVFLCALAFVVGSASATPEDLSNGVFIAHYAPAFIYTAPPCEYLEWSEDAIDECADQNTRIDGPGDHLVWYIICAWDEDKEWCTTQVGIEGYDCSIWLFQSNGPCYAGDGTGLEIYTNDFPHGDPPGGPSGVILTPSEGNWGPANFEEVWWFEGYAYGAAYGTTVVQLGVDPSTGFAGWYNCESPPGEFPAEDFGAMGVNTDGVYCCPMGMEYFACCFEDGTCELMTEELCAGAGGEFHPEWDYCEPNECPQPIIVCCFDDGSCQEITEEECLAAGGVVFWDLESCEPNECPPSGTDGASWGSIKAMYR
jgi:hypothetical protein